MLAKNRVFTVRIWGALEIKFRKRAKRDRCSTSHGAQPKAFNRRARRDCAENAEKFLMFFAFSILSQRSLWLKAFTMPQSLRRERIHFVEDANGFEHHTADDLQALGAEFVDGVLRGVPEDVVVAVHEIDEVGAGHSSFHKRH